MFKKAIIGAIGICGLSGLGWIVWDRYRELMGYRILMVLAYVDFLDEFADLDSEMRGLVAMEITRLLYKHHFRYQEVVDYIME